MAIFACQTENTDWSRYTVQFNVVTIVVLIRENKIFLENIHVMFLFRVASRNLRATVLHWMC